MVPASCTLIIGCSDGDIRLIGSTSWGRIEMCYSGYWSSVCNRGFNETAASVVCRELNFTSIGKHAIHSPNKINYRVAVASIDRQVMKKLILDNSHIVQLCISMHSFIREKAFREMKKDVGMTMHCSKK